MLGAMSLVTFERPGGIDFDIHILAERPLLAGLPFLFLSLLFSFFFNITVCVCVRWLAADILKVNASF